MGSALSEEQICSNALAMLGQNPITDLSGTNPHAILCNAIYASTRDALLEEHAWGFATRRVPLVVSTVTPAFGYAYQFALPADCIRVLEISPAGANHVVEYNYILADVDALSIRYIVRVTEPGRFSPAFAEAFACMLAAKLAMPILKKQSAVQMANALFDRALKIAKRCDSVQDNPTPPTDEEQSSWLASR